MTEPISAPERRLPQLPPAGEVQPLSEFGLTLLRYLPAILALVVLTVGATFLLTAPGADRDEVVATSQVGLTREVVWPFYDTARQRAVSTTSDPAFAADVGEQLGNDENFIALDVVAPDNQAFIEINATARNPAIAAEAANIAAALLLQRDNARLAADAQANLDVASSSLGDSEQRVAEADARLQELIPIEAAVRAQVAENPLDAERRETLLATELERTSLTQARTEELRQQVTLRIAADEARRSVEGVVPELELLGRAAPPAAVEGRSFGVLVVAGLVASVLGVALAMVWDRSNGRLASRWHAEQVARVPVVAELDTSSSTDRGVGLFLTRLLDAGHAGGNVIAVSGLEGARIDKWMGVAIDQLETAGVRVIGITELTADRSQYNLDRSVLWAKIHSADTLRSALDDVSTIFLPTLPSLSDIAELRWALSEIADWSELVLLRGDVVGSIESDYAASLADTTLLIADKNRNTVNQLRQGERAISASGGRLLGVVLDGESDRSASVRALVAERSQSVRPATQPTT